MQLHEQYRPSAWSEVAGQDKAIARIDRLRRRGLAGRTYWISGPSGTGKTTIARLIAAEVADIDWIEEIDATDLSPARLKDIERSMQIRGFGKGGRAYIVNEAHSLAKHTIRQLLVMLERLPASFSSPAATQTTASRPIRSPSRTGPGIASGCEKCSRATT
jgi:replication-associated recombination protein RarA